MKNQSGTLEHSSVDNSVAHTPAPWIADNPSELNNTIAIRNGKLSPLAYVQPRPFYDDTQAGNATLIAAAPDLLAALELIINMQVKGHALIDRLQFSDDGRAISEKVLSAIHKATGK